jgi:hypothetical protein
MSEYDCWIDIPLDDEDFISGALRKAFPSLQWQEGDSSWDKIRVWGEGPDLFVSIYRYEGPGLFRLRIRFLPANPNDPREEFYALREKVCVALRATLRGGSREV